MTHNNIASAQVTVVVDGKTYTHIGQLTLPDGGVFDYSAWRSPPNDSSLDLRDTQGNAVLTRYEPPLVGWSARVLDRIAELEAENKALLEALDPVTLLTRKLR